MSRFLPAQRPPNHQARLNAALAGAVGGVVGTLAMNYAQRLWTLALDGRAPASAADEHDARDWQERSEHQNGNEWAAQALATPVMHRRLTHRELSIAARAIHFAFGALVGAVHGLYVARNPVSRSTLRRPPEMHLQSFVAHLVYGVTTERVRRLAVNT